MTTYTDQDVKRALAKLKENDPGLREYSIFLDGLPLGWAYLGTEQERSAMEDKIREAHYRSMKTSLKALVKILKDGGDK